MPFLIEEVEDDEEEEWKMLAQFSHIELGMEIVALLEVNKNPWDFAPSLSRVIEP